MAKKMGEVQEFVEEALDQMLDNRDVDTLENVVRKLLMGYRRVAQSMLSGEAEEVLAEMNTIHTEIYDDLIKAGYTEAEDEDFDEDEDDLVDPEDEDDDKEIDDYVEDDDEDEDDD